jgi:enoyl-CoA hydratase/carnithine racemase
MSDADILLNDGKSPIRTLTLNRPEARNALSLDLLRELEGALQAANDEGSVRAVIISANGPAFSAGHDLREMTELRNETDGGRAAFQAIFDACASLMATIMTCPIPVIAQIQGMASAAGCQLVATCDLAVASTAANFATPGVNIGLFCSTPMVALSRNVPRKAAMEMLLTGDAIDAHEALRIGLVNRVVEPKELAQATRGLANHIVQKPGPVVRIGKEAFYRQLNMSVTDAYAFASQVMTENMLKEEAKEGIGAFTEKRAPKWPDH